MDHRIVGSLVLIALLLICCFMAMFYLLSESRGQTRAARYRWLAVGLLAVGILLWSV